jgi:hypothetical protein
MTDIVPFTELIAVPDTYVSGHAEVEDMQDGNYRITFYTRKKSIGFGIAENEINERLVMPVHAAILLVRAIMRVGGIQCCGGEKLRHLAH